MNGLAMLVAAPTSTVTGPVVAPTGTTMVIEDEDHDAATPADTPAKKTWLEP